MHILVVKLNAITRALIRTDINNKIIPRARAKGKFPIEVSSAMEVVITLVK